MAGSIRSSSSEPRFVAPSGFLAQVPFNAAVQVGDLILIAGQIGIDDAGVVVAGGVGEQTRICLQNARKILEALGASLADVVQTRIYITSFSEYADFNRVYQEFFSAPFPVRSTIGVAELALNAQIEIEFIAAKRGNT